MKLTETIFILFVFILSNFVLIKNYYLCFLIFDDYLIKQ